VRRILMVCAPLLLVALIAGCGQSTVARTSPPVTATAAPTATIQPTPVSTHGTVNSGLPCGGAVSGDVHFGDLRVNRVSFVNIAYPADELPSTLSTSQPYLFPMYSLPKYANGLPNPPVNPDPTYMFGICNTSSTASHVVISVAVRIDAFSAYSGPLNTWNGCAGYYQRPVGAILLGCGGGYNANEELKASFPSNATTGSQVVATQMATGVVPDPPYTKVPPLPVQLGPGQMLFVALHVTPPTAPGMYTFALSYDNVTAAPISTMQPTLYDSAAVQWNGQNCTAPALVAQIPTSDTQNRYICAPQ
jgi:hypothetical protein